MTKDLNQCFDAREWAAEFCRINSEFKARHGFDRPLDVSDMEPWFASALLTGHWQGTQDANEIWLKREIALFPTTFNGCHVRQIK